MKKIVVIILITLVVHGYTISLYNYSFTGYPQEAFSVFNNPTFYGWLGTYSINSGYGLLLNNVIKDKLDTKWLVAGCNYKNYFTAFGYQNLLLENIYSEELYILNFGTKLLYDSLFIGTNLKWYVYKYVYDEYYHDDPIADNAINIYNLDFGISKRFKNNIYSGISFLNLLTNKTGDNVKYTLPKKYCLYFGYNYGVTVLNFEVSFQNIEVDKFTHASIGYRLGLNQELFYSKLVSFDITAGATVGYKNTILDLSLQTRFLSNRLALKYTIVYTLADISGYVGNHYLMLNYQPKHIVKRKIVKREPEVIEEVVVVQPKKVQKKVVEEKVTEVIVTTPTVEIPKVVPEKIEPQEKVLQQEVVQEKVKIVEKKVVVPEYKFPVAHKVKEGETLISISEKYYNDKKKWRKIYEVNKDKIIKGVPIVGEVLIIPEP